MNKLAFPLLFFLILFISPVFAYSVNLTCTEVLDDAVARQSAPTTNYGYTNLMMGKYPTTAYRTFLKWNITNVLSEIVSAKLYIWVGSSVTNTTNLKIYNTSLNWTESNLTWNNMTPAYTEFFNAAVSTVPSTWAEFDITNMLKNYTSAGNTSMALFIQADNESVTGGFLSAYCEYSGVTMRPYMTIEYNETLTGACNPAAVDYQLGTTCQDIHTYVTNIDDCNLTTNYCPSNTTCQVFTSTFYYNGTLPSNETIDYAYIIGDTNTIACVNASNQIAYCVKADGSQIADPCVNINGTDSGTTIPIPTLTCPSNYTSYLYEYDCENVGCYWCGNKCSISSCPGTQTDNVSGLKAYMNAGLGTAFGADILSLLLSAMLGGLVFMKANYNLNAFAIPFMISLAACAFVGLFNAGFMILLGGLTLLMLFYKLKGG